MNTAVLTHLVVNAVKPHRQEADRLDWIKDRSKAV